MRAGGLARAVNELGAGVQSATPWVSNLDSANSTGTEN